MPSRFSVGDERGLANWPATRPTLMTGEEPAKVSTTAIWRNTRKKSRMLLAPCSAKLSAQSPPCNRKASPAVTLANAFFRLRASPAKTSGGNVASCASTSAKARASGYSGICFTGRERQLSGVQADVRDLDMTNSLSENRHLQSGGVGRYIHQADNYSPVAPDPKPIFAALRL